MSTPGASTPAEPVRPAGAGDVERARPSGAGPRAARAVAAAVAAAGIAWGLGEAGALTVKPAITLYMVMGATVLGPNGATRQAAEIRTSALTYGVFGALLGLGLGLAGGWSSGRGGRIGAASAGGAVAGGAAGAAASLAVLPLYFRWAGDRLGDPFLSLAMHAGLWAPLGAAAGLAFGLGLGRGGARGLAAAALGGLTGALLGTVAYDLLGAFNFPMAETVNPVAESRPARLATFLTLALFTAAGVLLGTRRAAPAAPGPAAGV